MNYFTIASAVIDHFRGSFYVIKWTFVLGLINSVSLLQMRSNPEMKVAMQRTNITLQCEFTAKRYDLFYNPPLWKKIQRGEETSINLMSNILNPLARSKRFMVEFHNLAPVYRMDLHIYNLSPEDSGNYTCEVRDSDSRVLAQVTHLVFVRAPVETLSLTDTTNTTKVAQHKRSITFIEGPYNKLRCVGTGGYPPPEMRVYIGNVDISNQLTWYQFPKLKGRKGMRVMTYYSERWSKNFDAKPQYDGQELTCAVDVTGYATNHTLSILHVHYSPVIRCYDTSAEVGETIVQLACDIWSKPRIATSYWVIDENGTQVKAEMTVFNDCWTQVEEQSNGAIRNSLFFRVVKRSSFRKYDLVAENDVGTTTHAVELVQKVVPTIPTRTGMRRKSGRTADEYKRKSYYIHSPSNAASSLGSLNAFSLFFISIIFLNNMFYTNNL